MGHASIVASREQQVTVLLVIAYASRQSQIGQCPNPLAIPKNASGFVVGSISRSHHGVDALKPFVMLDYGVVLADRAKERSSILAPVYLVFQVPSERAPRIDWAAKAITQLGLEDDVLKALVIQ
jgi:hypothetical protein